MSFYLLKMNTDLLSHVKFNQKSKAEPETPNDAVWYHHLARTSRDLHHLKTTSFLCVMLHLDVLSPCCSDPPSLLHLEDEMSKTPEELATAV